MDKAHLAHYFDDLTVDVMLKAYKRVGWPLFVNGDYNINLFSIRTENNDENRLGLIYPKFTRLPRSMANGS